MQLSPPPPPNRQHFIRASTHHSKIPKFIAPCTHSFPCPLPPCTTPTLLSFTPPFWNVLPRRSHLQQVFSVCIPTKPILTCLNTHAISATPPTALTDLCAQCTIVRYVCCTKDSVLAVVQALLTVANSRKRLSASMVPPKFCMTGLQSKACHQCSLITDLKNLL